MDAKAIQIADTVTSVGNYAFESCTNVSSITFLGDVPGIGSVIFRHITAPAYYPANNGTWTAEIRQNYGGTVERSIGYIAYQNRNAFAPGTEAYAYIWEIIHAVYGDAYDAEYEAG